MLPSNQRQLPYASILGLAIAVILVVNSMGVSCAPSGTRNNNDDDNSNGNRLLRSGLFGLFRRQTSQGDKEATTTDSSTESDTEDPRSQTELDAQKFMDSLPNADANNSPSTFRERVSDTFGLLRDGVSNQFRSMRENFSDTVEDLRDTWTPSQD